MKKKFKNYYEKILLRKGYFSKKYISPFDLRGLLDDPIEALKRSGGNPILINVPMILCRSMKSAAFPCNKESKNPFIETAQHYLNGKAQSYETSPLKNYYENFQPSNLGELLDLKVGKDMSPLTFTFPWESSPNPNKVKKKLKDIEKENISKGYSLSGNHGWHLIGPISTEKGNLEHERLIQTLVSIKERGYIRNNGFDGDILGRVLVRDDDKYVVIIYPGQHRIAALVALGYDHAPIRIGTSKVSIIYRKDVAMWPAVKSGFMNTKEALQFFDRIFDGKQPKICKI